MRIKKTYMVWGTPPNTFPAIPDVIAEVKTEQEALKIFQTAILNGYTNVGVYKSGKPIKRGETV